MVDHDLISLLVPLYRNDIHLLTVVECYLKHGDRGRMVDELLKIKSKAMERTENADKMVTRIMRTIKDD